MTVSSYLLWVTAAISLIGAILTISVVGRMADVYRELYAGTEVEGSEAVIVAISVVGVVVNILFAAGLAILAVFNNRGRQGARVTTWVLGGVALCCSGLVLLGTAATSSLNLDSTGTGGPSSSEVERRLSEVLPSWYEPLSTTLSVISLLTILGAVILLALPASNAFFRKPVGAGWDPSMPYPYPSAGQPPYPSAGQPPYPPAGQQGPGQPPYPTYPNPGQSGVPPYPTFNDPSVPAPTGPSPSTPTPPTPPPADRPGATPSTGPPSDPWSRPEDEDDRRPPSGPNA